MIMTKFINKFIHSESGASAVEYGILVGVVALVIITAAGTVGDNLTSNFTSVADALSQ
jgi:pilus assembly protein Flp/PilA